MLIRYSLIVAILAGLAVSGLNFIKVKEKITTIQGQRDQERTDKEAARTELASTKKDLAKTTADLTATKATLEATSAERDKAVAEATSKSKQLETVSADRDKIRKERDDSQAELAAYKGTDLKPEQIITMNKQFKEVQKALDGSQEENKLLGQKIVKINNELAIYKTPDYVVPLPPSLKGKVLITDPKWNFVIVDVGQDQGVLEQGELLINRNGKLVAKVKVRSVQKDRAIANVMPGWQLGEVMEGDQVIPAHPAS
jgi:hypothetical protein